MVERGRQSLDYREGAGVSAPADGNHGGAGRVFPMGVPLNLPVDHT